MEQLDARRYTQREIAAGSGVPFSTVTKVAQRSVKEPSVHTVQRLADWFRAQPNSGAVMSQSSEDDFFVLRCQSDCQKEAA